MNKKKFLVLILILGLFLVACASQRSPATNSTDSSSESNGGARVVATPTESPDLPDLTEAGPPVTADQVMSTLWQWQALLNIDQDGQTAVSDPQSFSIIFQDEGVMTIQADCNDVPASYVIDSEKLRIILGPSNMTFCDDEYLDVEFLNYLSKTIGGTMDEDGSLRLFTSDGATLRFSNAGKPTSSASDAAVDEIANLLWQWQDLVETQPAAQSIVPNPNKYTIGFRYDGALIVQADCNDLQDTYDLQGEQISLTLDQAALVLCGEESLNEEFLTLLNAVDTYTLVGDRLELKTSNGATMGFASSGKLAGTVGISPADISLDITGIAESWQAYVVQEQFYRDSMSAGLVGLPEHVLITFNGRTPQHLKSSDPLLMIVPVAAYEEMYRPNNDQPITRVMNQIGSMAYNLEQLSPTTSVPVLPLENESGGTYDLAVSTAKIGANPVSAAKNGFRFVGRWNQDDNPATNQDLRYVYQGFTNDGAYLVSFWYPVRTEALDDDSMALSQEKLGILNSDPTASVNNLAVILDQLDDGDWFPELSRLDAMLASLQIEGMISSGVQGKTWVWTSRGLGDSDSQPVDNPTHYTISYNNDGNFSYQADCNAGGGGYSVIGGFNGRLHHALGPATLAACAPDSRADEFLGALAAVESYRLLPGGQEMQLLLPTGDVLSFVDENFVEIDIPDPQPDAPTATVTADDGVFVRTGPGTYYPSLGVASLGETGTIIGLSEDSQWWVIEAPSVSAGQVWVSAALVDAQDAENVPVVPTPLLPAPVPTLSPVPPPSSDLSFTAVSKVLFQGDCTDLSWDMQNIDAVWIYPAGSNYQDFPQSEQGSHQVCLGQTTTYEMRVLHADGSTEIRSLTIEVNKT